MLLNYPGEFFEIINEAAMFQAASFLVRRTQNQRGMHGGHYVGSEGRFDKFAALFGDAKFWTKQRLRRSGAEGDNNFWFDYSDFSLEPGTASRDFAGVWFLLNAAFATRFPFEMFDNIGDVSLRPVDTGLDQCVIKQTPGGADERLAR